MFTKETYIQMEDELMALTKSHQSTFLNMMRNFEVSPHFTFFKCNIPLLADVKMLAERYGFADAVDSDDNWGYVILDFSLHCFEDENELENFSNIIKELHTTS